jgi:hypothetical protein
MVGIVEGVDFERAIELAMYAIDVAVDVFGGFI